MGLGSIQTEKVTMSHPLLAIEAANTLVRHNSNQINFQLPYWQHQKWFVLCWWLLSYWGCDCIAFSFAYTGCHYLYYIYPLPNHNLIIWLTRLNNINTPLTLIFRMGQWPCQFLCQLYMVQLLLLYITTTKSLYNNQTYKTKNHGHSIDAYCHDGVMEISYILLPEKAASFAYINYCHKLGFI